MRVGNRGGARRALRSRTLSPYRCWTTRSNMQRRTALVSAVRPSRERASACRWSQIRVSMFLHSSRLDARPEPTLSTICSLLSCKAISWLPPACQIRLQSLTTTTLLPPRLITTASPSSTSPLRAKTRTTRVARPFQASINWAPPCTIVHLVLSPLRAPSLAQRLMVRRLLFLLLLSLCATSTSLLLCRLSLVPPSFGNPKHPQTL
jgi:hypothetical protein